MPRNVKRKTFLYTGLNLWFQIFIANYHLWVVNLVVEVQEESSLLLILSLLSGEGTSGGVVSGFSEGADALVKFQGFHEVKSTGEGWDGVWRGEETMLSILEKPVSETTSNQEHDGVRSETVGEDGSSLEVLEDNGKLVGGSEHEEET